MSAEPVEMSPATAPATAPATEPATALPAGGATWRPRPERATLVLAALALATVVLVVAYLTIGVSGGWDFVLPFRGRRVAAMVVVGVAIATSTVVFQTMTANRILTPSIMGFDALYVAVQTTLVFAVGSIALVTWGVVADFTLSLAVMVACSLLLYGLLFGSGRRSLHLVLLVGVVLGTLLRSVTALLNRLMAPSEFQVLQSRLFASFTAVDERLLLLSAGVVVACVAALWRLRRQLDVLALGRDSAIALGVDHRRLTLGLLVLVVVLVATSTALVGPITFFGLLVANLAYSLSGSHRHAVTLPTAALLAVVTLVGGQVVLEHLLDQATVLSVVIEFIGGIVFIALLVAGARKP